MSRRRRAKNRSWALPLSLAGVFTIKLIVLLQLQDHPLLQPEGALDSAEYVRLAREVLGGNTWLGPGLYYVSPLYIYFVATVLAIADSYTFVRVVQIALGTAAVAGIFVSARAWFGLRAAWLAATLAALTGIFSFYEIVLFQSSIDPFLTSFGFASLGSLHPFAALIGGVVFGLQILNRPNIAIAIAGVGLVLLITRQWRAALWLSAGIALALGPIAARNAIVSHQFALTSSQGGLNLYIGNHAAATGQYTAIPGIRANIAGQAEDTRQVAEAAEGRPLSDAEVSSHFTRLAVAWIREHPCDALALFGRKLALTFSARHQWLDFSYPYYAYDTGSILRFLCVGPWLLVPLGFAGIVAGGRRSARYWAASAFVPLYAISVAIFFVGERYRLPLFVPLCVYSGGALDAVWTALADRFAWDRRRLIALVALAVGVVTCAWRFDLPDGRFEERLRLSKALLNRGDREGAAAELTRAYALRPGDTVTEFNLGMSLVGIGRAADGLSHVRHAVDAGVPIPGAGYALASATLASGDRDAAAALLRSYSPAEGETADSCYQVAMLALRAGAPDVAERYLRRALELRPGWPPAASALEEITRGR